MKNKILFAIAKILNLFNKVKVGNIVYNQSSRKPIKSVQKVTHLQGQKLGPIFILNASKPSHKSMFVL